MNKNMNFKGTVYILFDGQAGSCGKGKFVGTFARNLPITISINNNMPNSGHSFVFDDGKKVVTTHLPIAVVSPNVKYLIIGAGSAINPDILISELDRYSDLIGDRKIYIHERAAIVLPEHKERELENIKSGSTFKGSAAAVVDKIMRKPGVVLAKNYLWNNDKIQLIDDSFIQNVLEGKNDFTGKENILIETSQGFDLDINHGLDYPNVTSRQCSPAQALADCGIPHNVKTKTFMIFRPYPIRISNKTNNGDIYCGDYANSKEISWEEVAKRAYANEDLALREQTTVTKRTRRVFEFSDERFAKSIAITNPDYLILNFAQYLNYFTKNLNNDKLNKDFKKFKTSVDIEDQKFFNLANELYAFNQVSRFAYDIEQKYKTPVFCIGTGEKESDRINYLKISKDLKTEFENCPGL